MISRRSGIFGSSCSRTPAMAVQELVDLGTRRNARLRAWLHAGERARGGGAAQRVSQRYALREACDQHATEGISCRGSINGHHDESVLHYQPPGDLRTAAKRSQAPRHLQHTGQVQAGVKSIVDDILWDTDQALSRTA
jgi:hypothetical protein